MYTYENMSDTIFPSNVKFFNPNQEFLYWLHAFTQGRPVIEIGAGLCEFTQAMHEVGIRAMAIEPRANDEVRAKCHNFLLAEMFQELDIVKTWQALIVVARPDHGGWFETIPEYMHKYSQLMYIGLEQNVVQDMGNLNFEIVKRDVGEDGEIAILVSTGVQN